MSAAIMAVTDAWRGAWSTSTTRPVFVDRLQDRLQIQRRNRARIDHFRVDAFLCELLRRGERARNHPARCNDRDVASGATDLGLTERHQMLTIRNFAVLERQHVVVQEYHRVVVPDGGRHQSLGVSGRGGHHDFEARNTHEECGE